MKSRWMRWEKLEGLNPMEEMRNTFNILIGRTERKRLLSETHD
jgi:hypothetical protein